MQQELGASAEALTVEQLHKLIANLPNDVPPYVSGPPGVGKTALIERLAKERGAELVVIRASELRPEELIGLPTLETRGYTTYSPLYELYRTTTRYLEDNPTEDTRPIWLFLDEFTNAAPELMAGFQYLILHRTVGFGGFPLRKDVRIIAAGNRETDGCDTSPLSPALQSRFVHLELSPDRGEWLRWARTNGIHRTICAFLNQPRADEWFHDFDPRRDGPFACPRSWTALSSIYQRLDREMVIDPALRRAAVLGTVGTRVAKEFLHFADVVQHAPPASRIAEDPTKVPTFDERPEVALAVIELLIEAVRNDPEQYVDPALMYVARLHSEYQVLFCGAVLNRDGNMPREVVAAVLGSAHLGRLQDALRYTGSILEEAA